MKSLIHAKSRLIPVSKPVLRSSFVTFVLADPQTVPWPTVCPVCLTGRVPSATPGHFTPMDNVPQVRQKIVHANSIPDSKVHGANMGPSWGRRDSVGPHVGPMNFAIWDVSTVHSKRQQLKNMFWAMISCIVNLLWISLFCIHTYKYKYRKCPSRRRYRWWSIKSKSKFMLQSSANNTAFHMTRQWRQIKERNLTFSFSKYCYGVPGVFVFEKLWLLYRCGLEKIGWSVSVPYT